MLHRSPSRRLVRALPHCQLVLLVRPHLPAPASVSSFHRLRQALAHSEVEFLLAILVLLRAQCSPRPTPCLFLQLAFPPAQCQPSLRLLRSIPASLHLRFSATPLSPHPSYTR